MRWRFVSGAWPGFVFIRFQKNEPPAARLQRWHKMKLSTKRVNNHPPYRLCSEKGIEFCIGPVSRFFHEEVTAVKGVAADVVHPVPPHGQHVISRLATRPVGSTARGRGR
jgi:hypothetical protein